MKYVVPLIVASFLVAIATAMLETGPLTLPFLVGYLLGIVVPLVVFSGVLTLVALGIYRVLQRRNMPNPAAAMWGVWALVAGVNFYGNYQLIKERRAEQARQTAAELMAETQPEAQEGSGKSPAVLALQARFAKDSQRLDAELTRRVAEVQIPPLLEPAFLEDKSRFPEAQEHLEEYGQLFQTHKEERSRLLLQMRGEIEQLDLPHDEKLQAIHEFENTYGIDGKLSSKYFDIVIEVSQQGIAYLEFLDRARYKVSNGRVTFETDSDLERYGAFLQNLKRLSEKEVATQRALAESRQKRMARLRELSR